MMIDELTVLRTYGPQAHPLTNDVRLAARDRLLAQVAEAHPTPAPHRGSRVRRGLIAVAAVTAVLAGSLYVGLGAAQPVTANAAPLVSADPPTFPVTLTPEPAGMRRHLEKEDGWEAAFYQGAGRELALFVARDVSLLNARAVEANGRTLQVGIHDGMGAPAVAWRLSESQTVALVGAEGYDEAALLALVDHVTAVAQPVTPALARLPQGWRPVLWKAPRIITYARDGVRGAEEISVQLDTHRLQASDFTTLTDAVVDGRPAQIGRSGMGSVISATTKNGVRFDLVGPGSLSDERLIALAAGVQA